MRIISGRLMATIFKVINTHWAFILVPPYWAEREGSPVLWWRFQGSFPKKIGRGKFSLLIPTIISRKSFRESSKTWFSLSAAWVWALPEQSYFHFYLSTFTCHRRKSSSDNMDLYIIMFILWHIYAKFSHTRTFVGLSWHLTLFSWAHTDKVNISHISDIGRNP